ACHQVPPHVAAVVPNRRGDHTRPSRSLDTCQEQYVRAEKYAVGALSYLHLFCPSVLKRLAFLFELDLFGDALWLALSPARTLRYLLIHPAAAWKFAIAHPAPLISTPASAVSQSFLCIIEFEHIAGKHTCELKRRDIDAHTIVDI